MVRRILDWTQEKTDEIDVYNDKHPYLKSAGLGFLEGVIDGAVISYVCLIVCRLIILIKNKKED